MCRKLDMYWNQTIFDQVFKKSSPRSMMTQYIAKLSSISHAGKSYDDTLLEEGTLWEFMHQPEPDTATREAPIASFSSLDNVDVPELTEKTIAFWGPGYTPDMYADLEQRLKYWMSKLPRKDEMDIGTETLIKQICSIELDINRNRAAGKNVDKSVSSLMSLLKQANLTPDKQADGDATLAATPLGVWIYRFENERPLPEIDDDLKDVNHVKRYVFLWMGHLCKMLGLKNGYAKLYEDEIERLRVERPDYDEEDDETMMYDIFQEGYHEDR